MKGRGSRLQKTEKIWFDRKLIPWDEAKVHVLTHSLHYGLAVFEGIRCYKCTDGRSAVFRLREHIERLQESGRIVHLKIPYSIDEICAAVVETLRANRLDAGYIRPIAFIGEGEMGLFATSNPIHLAIAVWPWGTYLGDDGVKNGIRMMVSPYVRHHVNVERTRSKLTANYVDSILAKREAVAAGYDEAFLLNKEGYISEASGENVFIVKNGVLKTPPLTSPLPGITRASVMQFAKDQGIPVKEEYFDKEELCAAAEAFLTGTAAEITPIREVEGHTIGSGRPGEMTKRLQEAFFATVRGEEPRYIGWLTFI